MAATTFERVTNRVKEDWVVGLAKKLIDIPSFKTEESPIALFLASNFRRWGYEVDLQEVDPGRYQVIATLRGTGGGKTLMLNGHIDQDPLSMGWKRDPWTSSVEGDRLYGAGIYNMKGGVASIVAAAEAVRRAKALLKGDLQVACVVGELQGGVGTEYALEHGYRPDMAIVAEPNDADTVLTVHAGWLEMAVHVLGESRHISQKESGINAIQKMSKAIEAINGLELSHTPFAALPSLPRLHVGAVIGGQGRNHVINGPNFVPDFCTALVDGRMVPGQTSSGVLKEVRRALDAVKASDPEFEYEIEMPPPADYRVLRTVMEPMNMPTDEEIVKSVARGFRAVTGGELAYVGSKTPNSYSGNDTTHMWKAGIPCVLYGPGGDWDAREDEPDHYVRISDMVTCAKVMAATALDVCNQEG